MINLATLIKKERPFVCLYSTFLVLLTVFPYFYGALTTPKEKLFTWTTFKYPSDYNAYQAWTIQYSQGKILTQDLYTTESHPSLFFHPIFFLAGQINRFFKIPPELIFIIFSILSNLLLLLVLYYFITYFIKDRPSRLISFFFISLSGGLGWLLGGRAADLYLSELSFFGILSWPFIMALALSLLLYSLLSFIKSLRENNIRQTLLSGLCLFLLAWIHPYDLFIFYPLAIFYLLFFTKFWKNFGKSIIVFIFPLPIILYYLWLTNSHFVWQANSSALMILSSPRKYLWGLFPSIVLAIFSLKMALKDKKLRIIAVFVLVQLSLLCLPISIQWKLSLGIIVPLGILSGLSLNNLYQLLNKRFGQPTGLFALYIIIFFASLSNLVTFVATIQTFQQKDYPYYISRDIKEGLDWLAVNTGSDDAIFCSYQVGGFIPRYSGRKVFVGHWAQTVYVKEKKLLAEKFFGNTLTPEQSKQLFAKYKINYIFYSDFEKKYGPRNLMQFGKEIFKNNSVEILKVNL